MTFRPRLSWVRPFLVSVLVIAVPIVLYWFGYVQHSVDAALRQHAVTVAAVATSLQGRLGALDQVARTAENLPRGEDRLRYLRSLVEKSGPAVGVREAGGAVYHLTLPADAKGVLLSVGTENRKVESLSVELESLIPWDIIEGQLDGLVVLSSSGKLLAQDRRLPAQAGGLPLPVTRDGQRVDVGALFDRAAGASAAAGTNPTAGDAAVAGAPSRTAEWRSPIDFSRHDATTIAGTRYLVFLQPFRTYTAAIATGSGSPTKTESGTVDLVVAGLVAEDRVRRESRALSPHTLARVLALVGLGVFLIPFLKLRFLGQRERMRLRDVWMMAAALLAMTAVVVLLVLDGAAVDTLRARFDQGLHRLHEDIQQRADAEVSRAVAQLEAAPGLPGYCEALGAEPSEAPGGPDQGPCNSTGPRTAVSEDTKGSLLLANTDINYPTFDSIFLADNEGKQVLKWSPRTIPTGLVPVHDRGYFIDALALRKEGGGQSETAREFVVSRTSGQEQMVFALPVEARTGKLGVAVPTPRRTHVAALVTGMRSLSHTVVPLPYEYVLVKRDGTVAFRNAKGPYLGERFFEQVHGGSVLTPAGQDEAAAVRELSYRSRTYRMLASDAPALRMTLVTFYDVEIARRLAARASGVAALFALAAAASALFGSFVARLCWGRASQDWLWPDSQRTVRYLMGTGLCLVVVVLMAVLRATLPAGWCAVFILLLPGLLTFTAGSPLTFRPPTGRAPTASEWRPAVHKAAYWTFLSSMLLALVAAPTILALDDALNLYSAAYGRLAALQWRGDVDEAARRFAAEYAEIEGSPPSNNKDPTCNVPERICVMPEHYETLGAGLIDQADTRIGRCPEAHPVSGLYDGCVVPNGQDDRGAGENADVVSCRFVLEANQSEPGLGFTRLFARPLAGLGDVGPSYAWALDGMSAGPAPGTWSRPLSGWTWSGWLPFRVAGGLALLGFLICAVAVHVLGLGWRTERPLDLSARVDPAPGTRWLIIRPTREWLGGLAARATRVVDLHAGFELPPVVAPSASDVVLIQHAEVALARPDMSSWLLALASAPAEGCLILCSEVDPLHYVSQRGEEQEAAWAAALRGFEKVRMRPPAFPDLGSRVQPAHRALLESECGRSEELIDIARRLASSPEVAERHADEIVELVLDAAQPYYRSLWDVCSQDERLVLVQLAEEGVINPKRLEVVRELHRRGLVDVDPRFQLMNRSFTEFVRRAESPARVRQWEFTPAALAWKRLGVPLYTLAAVVVSILLYMQQDLVSQLLGLATGAAGALNVLRNLGVLASAAGGKAKDTASV